MSYTAVDGVEFECYAALLVVNARLKECALHKFFNVAANVLQVGVKRSRISPRVQAQCL
jgi:hypothetical protein